MRAFSMAVRRTLARGVRLTSLARARRLCVLSAEDCPWQILGVARGTSRQDVKRRFYELAKQTHPDVSPSASDEGTASCDVSARSEAVESDADLRSEAAPIFSFIEIRSAFEAVMDALENGGGVSSTAPNASARGHNEPQRGSARRGKRVTRVRTLAEVLCERLEEEPHEALEVWGDIVERQLEVNESALEALFRACGARGGGGLPQALDILRDASKLGLLSAAKRQAALIFLIKWCKEDSSSFALISSQLDEDDRTAEVRELLAYANALYSGYSDGYSA